MTPPVTVRALCLGAGAEDEDKEDDEDGKVETG